MSGKVLLVLLIILVSIQFVRPARNTTQKEQVSAISKGYSVPSDVELILDNACFDCHSNNTKYLWYNNIQPVKKLI